MSPCVLSVSVAVAELSRHGGVGGLSCKLHG